MALLSLTLARSGTCQSTFIKAEEGPSPYHPVTHTLDGGLSHTTSPTRADKKDRRRKIHRNGRSRSKPPWF